MEKTEIEIKRGPNVIVTYDSDENIVRHYTRKGVAIECSLPEDWPLVNIVEFMEKLINAELI